MSPNELQTAALAAGYAKRDPMNGALLVTNQDGLYWLAHREGVHWGTVDYAFGLLSGTTSSYAMMHRLDPLTGHTGKNRQPDLPVMLGVPRGSGFEGTPAAPIGPASVYSPDDPIGPPPPTDEERKAAWLDLIYRRQWRMPADAICIAADAALQGVELADAERWMALESGAIGAAVGADLLARGAAG